MNLRLYLLLRLLFSRRLKYNDNKSPINLFMGFGGNRIKDNDGSNHLIYYKILNRFRIQIKLVVTVLLNPLNGIDN